MVEFIKKNKLVIVLVFVLALFIFYYFFREYRASKEIYTESYLDGKDYIMIPKTYGVNEYSPVNITEAQMAKIYLNDYIKKMYTDMESAYNLLDEDYKVKKFVDFSGYVNYVNSLPQQKYEVDRYYVDTHEDYRLYWVYDKNDNLFVFKAYGVMQYTVYLDDFTVEI